MNLNINKITYIWLGTGKLQGRYKMGMAAEERSHFRELHDNVPLSLWQLVAPLLVYTVSVYS